MPVRSVAGGKARLGEALDAEEREELVLGMLERTLDVLGAWTPCTRVHVVTQDLRVARSVAGPVVSDDPAGDGRPQRGHHAGSRRGAP